ncbi:JmjC domain-containing protein [Tanacetum coccineum]
MCRSGNDDGVEEVTGMVEMAVGVTGWRWWCYGGVGGEAAGGGGGEWLRKRDKIYGDPEAADIVFTSGANIHVVGINTTAQVKLSVNFTVIVMRNLMMFMDGCYELEEKKTRTKPKKAKNNGDGGKKKNSSNDNKGVVILSNDDVPSLKFTCPTRHHVLDKNVTLSGLLAMLRGYEGSGPILSINSWAKFKWFEADFGWGPPDETRLMDHQTSMSI